MEWITRLNRAIHHVEAHLTEEIEYEELGQIACCSSYHFQRIFAYMAGMTLTEYVRRRRMSLAAVDLQNGQDKVLDLALKYGYTSPTAFNRAFQSVHGLPPSAAKEQGVVLKSFLPISFKITIQGAQEMDYRIEKKQSFRIVGVSQPVHADMEQNVTIIPPMWGKVAMDGTLAKLMSMMDGQIKGIMGVGTYAAEGECRYWIATPSTQPVSGELEEWTVPAFTWAIFTGNGQCPQAIQDLERRIITQWLPTSGYEYANGPDIEVYLNADMSNAQFEVWIPVVQK